MNTNHDIIITTLGNTNFTVENVHSLVSEAWQQWFEAGLESVASHLTEERFATVVKRSDVFVALDKNTGELSGCHFLRADRKRNCIIGSFLAVSPKAQGHGIATALLAEEIARAIKAGYAYMQGSTAPQAVWSVRWHLKNGYRIIGYSRSPERNHPLYVFRRQLTPSVFWSGPLAPITAKLRFMATYLATVICKDQQGHLNPIGRLVMKFQHRWKQGNNQAEA